MAKNWGVINVPVWHTVRTACGSFLFVTFLLVTILLHGCVTQKKCLRKFPPAVDTITTVVFRDSVVYRDTVVFVRIPGRVIIDSVVIPCPPPKATYIPDTAKAETEYAKAKAWWSYPKIQLELKQKESRLEIELDSVIMEAFYWQSEVQRITREFNERYIPKWIMYLAVIGGIVLTLFLFQLARKFFKF